MKSRKTRVLAILLVLSLLGAACSKSSDTKEKKKTEDTDYEKHSMETKDPDATEETTEATEPSQRDTSVRPVSTPTPTPEPIPMLTASDIQNMNNNNALIVYNDEGNVSTIVGRFFHRPVADEDDAINAIKGVQELLGLQTGYFPFAVYGERYQGYTFYTYQQMKGDITVTNATLKIVLDPEGYPCMLQSSLASNLDYTPSSPTITEKDAEDLILNAFGSGYRVLSEYTTTTVYTDYARAQHCYQVYTNNPMDNSSFDMPYVVHFISYDGEYLNGYPTAFLPTDPFADFGNDSYFKDMVPSDYSFTITINGIQVDTIIPISKNTVDGKYYLCDPNRKIIVADYYAFEFEGKLQFDTQDDPNSFNAYHLLNYYYYTKAYDFYKEFNIESTDGFGMPILILDGYCNENGKPIQNCCNMGIQYGWSVFAATDGYSFGHSLDLVGHEYTHGVTFYSKQGVQYYNEYGAINEAYSDIMGNIMEMYMGETSDTEWAVGERSGDECRSMSYPYKHYQPMYVGDLFYISTSPLSRMSGLDDKGGVHDNSSLLSHMCYYLYMNGMSLEDLTWFFLASIEMQTPNADYDDFYAIFVASARLTGHEEIIPLLTDYWESAGLNGSREKTAESTTLEGYERINIPFYSPQVGAYCVVQLIDEYGNLYLYTTMQWDGIATFLAPAKGSPFILGITEYTDASLSTVAKDVWLNHDLTAWTDNPYDLGIIYFESGKVTTFPTYQ
ncbi:MAG: M4 family metallopeptidase [Clostridiales bacterium]|nr:M4 family metallopeptidase [Clostridiales bacterium]